MLAGCRAVLSSSYNLKVVVIQWTLTHHSSIQPFHQLPVLVLGVISCPIFPHHVSDSSCLGKTKVLNVIINLLVTYYNLSNNRQNIDRPNIGYRNLPVLHPLHSDIALRLKTFQRDSYRCTAHTHRRHLSIIYCRNLGIGTGPGYLSS